MKTSGNYCIITIVSELQQQIFHSQGDNGMSIYKEKDGLRYDMEQIWESGSSDQFPKNITNLVEDYKSIEEYMNEHCHPNATLGAAVNIDGLLTDHGPDHVRMVAENAKQLVGDFSLRRLNGYEIYLLLLAIHFHDVGNCFGREEHEKKIDEVMCALGDKLPLDTAERLMVSDIATAHGGYTSGSTEDKDTLKPLKSIDSCNGITIRPALLAAILRFADELSDDNTRCNRFLDKLGVIPPENQIFHAYSAALAPITFNANVIDFKYYIPYEQSQEKIPNEDGSFLYDEIMKRLKKCMRELEYCRKYAEGFIRITTLNVELNVMDARITHRPKVSTRFTLRLSGYPNEFAGSIDSLEYQNGVELKSATL